MLAKKTDLEIATLQEGGKILSQILHAVAEEVKPGISGLELNQLAEKLIVEAKAKPSFKNYRGFPNALCVSINQTVVHGIPNKQPLQEGDIVGLDLGLKYKGLYTDMALTVGVGKISKEAQQLITVTKKALEIAISQVGPGKGLEEIGRAIEKFIKPHGYGIVQDLAGHGVGHAVHEDPLIPNYDTGQKLAKMFPGLVLAIEPMIIMGGDHRIAVADNNWNVNSQDGSLSAHFEHSVVVTDDGCMILTE
ncbi:MAG: type I methionyl aminopeptidase [Patescibacteria group bacterium]|jgi:methionyl aminopeptidase